MEQTLCQEHRNSCHLMCLNVECANRMMCLLCEHNHQMYSSILTPTTIPYSKFKQVLDSEIDRSFQSSDQIFDITTQKKMIQNYYDCLKRGVIDMLDKKKAQNVEILAGNPKSDISRLKNARIKGDYCQLSPKMFEMALQIYNGENFHEIVEKYMSFRVEKAFEFLTELYNKMNELFNSIDCVFKVKPPEMKKQNKIPRANYKADQFEGQELSGKVQVDFKYQNTEQFGSILTDCLSNLKEIITVSYDKKLRVFDKKLQLISEKEYGNILSKICPIGDDTYAIGMSKQLVIEKISAESGYNPETLLQLKGSTERINDIHAFNTRIIGTSSDEGSKIWDLYKEKCEYTIRDRANPTCFRFLQANRNIVVGYNSHQVKIYSLENMKTIRMYSIPGVPLMLSQENRNQNMIYFSGFSSHFGLIDNRLSKLTFCHDFGSEAISTFKESLFQEDSVVLGQRGGKCRIFDLRRFKTRYAWEAHKGMTKLSKPNGVIKIFEQNSLEILTAGCNDRLLKVWQLKRS